MDFYEAMRRAPPGLLPYPRANRVEASLRVRLVQPGRVSFSGLNSWYTVPPSLETVMREAKRTGRKVKVEADRGCAILAAEIDGK